MFCYFCYVIVLERLVVSGNSSKEQFRASINFDVFNMISHFAQGKHALYAGKENVLFSLFLKLSLHVFSSLRNFFNCSLFFGKANWLS